MAENFQADVVVVSATPGGIAAAIGAARKGCSVLLLERTSHIGGLIANGLGATDVMTRDATAGLFRTLMRRILSFYTAKYGADSAQVRDCSGGYHFEPSVAEGILNEMIGEYPLITVRLQRQFDAAPENVILSGNRLTGIRILNRQTGEVEVIRGGVFIDATYEGDLAAAAGVPYYLGREGAGDFNEPLAGQVYKLWEGEVLPGSTGLGDNAVQAYNYRLPLTRDPANRVPISKPKGYSREEYASLADDILLNRHTGPKHAKHYEWFWNDIGRVVNMVILPNGKTDANNQHKAFLSTDLPEENWPWPTAKWAWRDRFADRLRAYTLGLLWFCQNDPALPAEFREHCSEWGLARDEYADNGHFPRQVYVREGRRIAGEYLFTAHDALPSAAGRPPIHRDSVTAGHYNLDSHAVRKREPDRAALDGMFSYDAQPYTVPYGVMVPQRIDGLLVPVAASATHLGFSTLRMEPCWLALGEAAGTAAALALEAKVEPRAVNIEALQSDLLRNGARLILHRDVPMDHPHFEALQMLGLRGLIPQWEARPDEPVTAGDIEAWSQAVGQAPVVPANGATTRGEFLSELWRRTDGCR